MAAARDTLAYAAARSAAQARNWAADATEAAAEAREWASVAAKARAEAEGWASVAVRAEDREPVAAEANAEAQRCLSVSAEALAEAERCGSVVANAASHAENWASVAIAALAKRRSLAEASQDNADIKKGLKEEEKEEELVITNPKLASLIYHCFNIAFVLQVVFFIAHIVIYYNTSESWWQALVATAVVSPILIAPLYVTPMLRDVFVRAYAMAPSEKCSSDLTSKLLFSEEV